MATLLLAAAGSAAGGAIGGSVLGVGAATIGGALGTVAGSLIDQRIIAGMAPDQRVEGPRLDSLRVTGATEGAPIPRVYGRMRVPGNVIWATDFLETATTETTGGGGKGGGGPRVSTTSYAYTASFAVALCEGRIAGLGRIWADGELMDLTGATMRVHEGGETQARDPLIRSVMGDDATPAYRGTAYVVFEDLDLAPFGNRIPQLSFEVFRPALHDDDALEALVKSVTLIPASGEWTYATQPVVRMEGAESISENVNALAETADLEVSLDRLQALCPNVESVSLVVSWFGTDLRADHCEIKPGVDLAAKVTEPLTWSVNGVSRAAAHLISTDAEGRAAYGGTPADAAVVQAIQAIKARGLRVTFYPFILMDVPPGNGLPDPYSANANGTGQPKYPWRGRITCSPAAGYAGTVDKTPVAQDQVEAFFGGAVRADFDVSGTTVTWTGDPTDWGLRRMILHYAHLCEAAGGVDAFLVGTEMRGITQVRDGPASYPAVDEFKLLANAVRAIVGPSCRISYAADWSEYFGHHPDDGSGDVFFHLDPLWAHDEIDFVGIDNYMPLSDWRDGDAHLDRLAGWESIHDPAYLRSNLRGGEGFDWFYASTQDRNAQVRTPIADGAHGKDWVFRYKDLENWWKRNHYDRPGGVEASTRTAWRPEMKPIRFTEIGCPAVDKGANQPNVFFDPKSSESRLPHFSRGWRDDAMQRAFLEAALGWWDDPANNPASSQYSGRMVETAENAVWTWDARPYPAFPALTEVWADGDNWERGHWINGRLGAVSLARLVRRLCREGGLAADEIDVTRLEGTVIGFLVPQIESARASIATLARYHGFDGIESEGRIRFMPRGGSPALTVTPDDLVAPDGEGEAFELVRGQETELPAALKWTAMRGDEDYDTVAVEAHREIGRHERIAGESFPIAVMPADAERRVLAALRDEWTGREHAMFRLPPSRLALDPGDVVALDHGGRQVSYRIASVADAEARAVEGVQVDSEAFRRGPGRARRARPRRPAVLGKPVVAFLDLPQLSESVPAHHPLVAAVSIPWPGEVAVLRSPTDAAWERVATLTAPARMGALATDLAAGPTSRLDLATAVEVEMIQGALQGATDDALFEGADALAVETAAGWEILQFGVAELVAPRRYRLSRLLRGQRGTEGAMGDPTVAGARVVLLDGAVVPVPISEADVGRTFNWRVGAASKPVDSRVYRQASFTPGGAGLIPFSPVLVEQPWRRPRAPGDLAIRWTRRSRVPAADSWEAAEIPLGEETEAWEVDVMNGETVLRTLTSGAASVVYPEADQVADFGAALGPGAALDLRIHQLSAFAGRGRPAVVTLRF